jgi:hypothetical protein
MPVHETLALWEFPADTAYAAMVQFALARVGEPDAYGVLLSSRDEIIGLQIVDGRLTGDGSSRFYVENRGGYVLVRREEWPPAQPGGALRTVLTLRAWPHRDRAA